MMVHKAWKRGLIAGVVAGLMTVGVTPASAQQKDPPEKQKQTAGSEEKAGAAGGLVAASALEGTRVVDKRNREIGSITNLFIDPQSGKIARAAIEFNKQTFGGQKYSVTWDQLSVTRQDGKLVVTLDESVLDRVQSAAQKDKKPSSGEMTAQQKQSEFAKQQKSDGAVVGPSSAGQTQERQQLSASQLSSDQIRKVQQQLNKEGFHAGQVNGQWTSETQSAIRNFQQTKGLPATGELDQRTIEELGLNADDFRQKGATGVMIEPADKSGGSESTSGRTGTSAQP
jgi:sporulation protein YlmC with PRC-barrel domain